MEVQKVKVTGNEARTLNRIHALKRIINSHTSELAKLRELLMQSERYNFNAPAIYSTQEQGPVLEVIKRNGKCPSLNTEDILIFLAKKKRMDILPKIIGSIDKQKFIAEIGADMPKGLIPTAKKESIWNFIGLK